MTILSCGCQSGDSGIEAEWDAISREGKPAIECGFICQKHFEIYDARTPEPEAQREPVAWMNKDGWIGLYKQGDANIPLYTTPPQRTWVGLTDEEMDEALNECNTTDIYKYFRAIEAKLKDKNT